ncbi:unnamed protein product [Rotaria magnacalcarata]|uniref:Uncharacterized protein n=1 Tax=Rotaria magnacalcarata TaxID=392030 RepID=A0A820BAH7_9BILA|nr:unnamed protein product [Rotaria magnacalcarata]
MEDSDSSTTLLSEEKRRRKEKDLNQEEANETLNRPRPNSETIKNLSEKINFGVNGLPRDLDEEIHSGLAGNEGRATVDQDLGLEEFAQQESLPVILVRGILPDLVKTSSPLKVAKYFEESRIGTAGIIGIKRNIVKNLWAVTIKHIDITLLKKILELTKIGPWEVTCARPAEKRLFGVVGPIHDKDFREEDMVRLDENIVEAKRIYKGSKRDVKTAFFRLEFKVEVPRDFKIGKKTYAEAAKPLRGTQEEGSVESQGDNILERRPRPYPLTPEIIEVPMSHPVFNTMFSDPLKFCEFLAEAIKQSEKATSKSEQIEKIFVTLKKHFDQKLTKGRNSKELQQGITIEKHCEIQKRNEIRKEPETEEQKNNEKLRNPTGSNNIKEDTTKTGAKAKPIQSRYGYRTNIPMGRNSNSKEFGPSVQSQTNHG